MTFPGDHSELFKIHNILYTENIDCLFLPLVFRRRSRARCRIRESCSVSSSMAYLAPHHPNYFTPYWFTPLYDEWNICFCRISGINASHHSRTGKSRMCQLIEITACRAFRSNIQRLISNLCRQFHRHLFLSEFRVTLLEPAARVPCFGTW